MVLEQIGVQTEFLDGIIGISVVVGLFYVALRIQETRYGPENTISTDKKKLQSEEKDEKSHLRNIGSTLKEWGEEGVDTIKKHMGTPQKKWSRAEETLQSIVEEVENEATISGLDNIDLSPTKKELNRVRNDVKHVLERKVESKNTLSDQEEKIETLEKEIQKEVQDLKNEKKTLNDLELNEAEKAKEEADHDQKKAREDENIVEEIKAEIEQIDTIRKDLNDLYTVVDDIREKYETIEEETKLFLSVGKKVRKRIDNVNDDMTKNDIERLRNVLEDIKESKSVLQNITDTYTEMKEMRNNVRQEFTDLQNYIQESITLLDDIQDEVKT